MPTVEKEPGGVPPQWGVQAKKHPGEKRKKKRKTSDARRIPNPLVRGVRERLAAVAGERPKIPSRKMGLRQMAKSEPNSLFGAVNSTLALKKYIVSRVVCTNVVGERPWWA